MGSGQSGNFSGPGAGSIHHLVGLYDDFFTGHPVYKVHRCNLPAPFMKSGDLVMTQKSGPMLSGLKHVLQRQHEWIDGDIFYHVGGNHPG